MMKLQSTLILAAALVAISHLVCCAQSGGGGAATCRPSSCGDIRNISYPFRLRGDPPGCGLPQYELKCEGGNITILALPPVRYWVKAIWYEDQAIQVIDARAMAGPSFLLSPSSTDTYIPKDRFTWQQQTNFVMFANCSSPVEGRRSFVEANSCITNASSSSSSSTAAAAGGHLYWFIDYCQDKESCGLPTGCHVVGTWLSEYYYYRYYLGSLRRAPPRCPEVRDALLRGFNLTWDGYLFCYEHPCPPPRDDDGDCYHRWFKSLPCE